MSSSPEPAGTSQSLPPKGAMLSSFSQQVRRNIVPILLVYGFFLLVMSMTWMNRFNLNGVIRLDKFFRDPLAVAYSQGVKLPFYIGIVSNIGVMIWSGAAGIALLGYALIRKLTPGDIEMRRLLGMGGILTFLWVSDDLLMIHEELIPEVIFHEDSFLHIKEGAVLIAYAIYTLCFLWRCRLTIVYRTDFALLVLALCGLFGSILADKAGLKYIVDDSKIRTFVEDGLKFFGILGWTLYFAHTVYNVVVQAFSKRLN